MCRLGIFIFINLLSAETFESCQIGTLLQLLLFVCVCDVLANSEILDLSSSLLFFRLFLTIGISFPHVKDKPLENTINRRGQISYMLVIQFCLLLLDPMDPSPPGSSVHGILQARILEWVATSTPGDLPDTGSNPGLPHHRQILYHLSYQGSPLIKYE